MTTAMPLTPLTTTTQVPSPYGPGYAPNLDHPHLASCCCPFCNYWRWPGWRWPYPSPYPMPIYPVVTLIAN